MGSFRICIFYRTECPCFLFVGGGFWVCNHPLSEVLKILFYVFGVSEFISGLKECLFCPSTLPTKVWSFSVFELSASESAVSFL